MKRRRVKTMNRYEETTDRLKKTLRHNERFAVGLWIATLIIAVDSVLVPRLSGAFLALLIALWGYVFLLAEQRRLELLLFCEEMDEAEAAEWRARRKEGRP
jgi:Flp pilus assembly protein TadB